MAYKAALVVVILAVIAILFISHSFDGSIRRYYPTPGFDVSQIPDLTGKVAIVTGGNSGVGRESVLELARNGAHVIFTSRKLQTALDVAKEIEIELQNFPKHGKIEGVALDLSSTRNVRAFVKEFRSKNLPLHILMNNAGIGLVPFSKTEDGIEYQLGTNHVGHFLLTSELLDILESSAPSRVVVVSSGAHLFASKGMELDKVNSEDNYDPNTNYAKSKLANILYTKELARRVEGKGVYVNAIHPGFVATNFTRNIEGTYGRIADLFARVFVPMLALNSKEGAITQLYVATSPDIETRKIHGEYFQPIAIKGVVSAHASNQTLQRELWEFTEHFLASLRL